MSLGVVNCSVHTGVLGIGRALYGGRSVEFFVIHCAGEIFLDDLKEEETYLSGMVWKVPCASSRQWL